MKLYVLGNPAYEPDSLAIHVGEQLTQDFSIIPLATPFDLLALLEKDPEALNEAILLDVAYGVKEPKLFQDLNKLRTIRFGSMHDFDMAFFMKLLNAIDKLASPRILALPVNMPLDEAVVAVKKLTKTI